MAYFDKDGNKKFSLKEKVQYHKKCANSGRDKNGNPLSTTERVNHALAANRATQKLGKFAKAKEIASRKFK